jgi:hypothetical protein
MTSIHHATTLCGLPRDGIVVFRPCKKQLRETGVSSFADYGPSCHALTDCPESWCQEIPRDCPAGHRIVGLTAKERNPPDCRFLPADDTHSFDGQVGGGARGSFTALRPELIFHLVAPPVSLSRIRNHPSLAGSISVTSTVSIGLMRSPQMN